LLTSPETPLYLWNLNVTVADMDKNVTNCHFQLMHCLEISRIFEWYGVP